MSNTTIQIKRSSVTTAPTSLSAGEQAYSYLSDKLFIGTSDGSGTIAIGGKYFIDQLNVAFAVANAAFGVANSSTVANQSYTIANAAFDVANAAFGKANSANVLAYNTGVGANAYAAAVGTSANAYSDATFLPKTGGTITSDLVVSGNLTISGQTTYANTQTLLIGDNILTLNNDLPADVAPSENAGLEVKRGSSANVGVIWNEAYDVWTFTNDGSTYLAIASNNDLQSANNYAGYLANTGRDAAMSVAASYYSTGNTHMVNTTNALRDYVNTSVTAANTFASSVGTSPNVYATAVGVAANTYAAAVGVSANAYAAVVGAAANTNAANASYLSTGTVVVARGGTGLNTLTTNGVIYGNGTGAVGVTSSGSEGNVLQVNGSGVPQFGMLDGGSF